MSKDYPSLEAIEHAWLNTLRSHSACVGKNSDPISSDDLKRIIATALTAHNAYLRVSAMSEKPSQDPCDEWNISLLIKRAA